MNRKFPVTMVALGAVVALAACASSTPKSSAGGDPGSPTATATSSSPSPTSAAAAPLEISASGLLKGTAHPTFPAGTPGKITVVQMGVLDRSETGSATLPIAIRNNTSAAISHVDITATAWNAAGKIATTGKSQGTDPAQLPPGAVGLSFIYFEHEKSLPKGATYDFTFETIPADTSSYNTASLKVTEAAKSDGSVAGGGVNTTGKPLTGPYSVQVYCFVGNRMTAVAGGFADQSDDIKANEKVTFTNDLYGTSCPKYLVGITGFFS